MITENPVTLATEIPAVTPIVAPEPQKNSKKNLIIFLIVTAVLILTGLVVLTANVISQLASNGSLVPTTVPTPAVTQTVTPTSSEDTTVIPTVSGNIGNFQTYRNESLNFIVSYPESWTLNDSQIANKEILLAKGSYEVGFILIDDFGPEVCVFDDTAPGTIEPYHNTVDSYSKVITEFYELRRPTGNTVKENYQNTICSRNVNSSGHFVDAVSYGEKGGIIYYEFQGERNMAIENEIDNILSTFDLIH